MDKAAFVLHPSRVSLQKQRDVSENALHIKYNMVDTWHYLVFVVQKTFQKVKVQGWAKDWSLGCVNPASWLRGRYHAT